MNKDQKDPEKFKRMSFVVPIETYEAIQEHISYGHREKLIGVVLGELAKELADDHTCVKMARILRKLDGKNQDEPSIFAL